MSNDVIRNMLSSIAALNDAVEAHNEAIQALTAAVRAINARDMDKR